MRLIDAFSNYFIYIHLYVFFKCANISREICFLVVKTRKYFEKSFVSETDHICKETTAAQRIHA